MILFRLYLSRACLFSAVFVMFSQCEATRTGDDLDLEASVAADATSDFEKLMDIAGDWTKMAYLPGGSEARDKARGIYTQMVSASEDPDELECIAARVAFMRLFEESNGYDSAFVLTASPQKWRCILDEDAFATGASATDVCIKEACVKAASNSTVPKQLARIVVRLLCLRFSDAVGAAKDTYIKAVEASTAHEVLWHIVEYLVDGRLFCADLEAYKEAGRFSDENWRSQNPEQNPEQTIRELFKLERCDRLSIFPVIYLLEKMLRTSGIPEAEEHANVIQRVLLSCVRTERKELLGFQVAPCGQLVTVFRPAVVFTSAAGEAAAWLAAEPSRIERRRLLRSRLGLMGAERS
jgi:hypothetical protein